MDFVFRLLKDSTGNTGIVVFVDRLSRMAHLAAVPATIDGEGTARLFIDRVFRQHGLPMAIISDRDPVSRVPSGNRFSECLALNWTCPRLTTPRLMVRRNVSTASLETFYALCVLRHQSAGAQCSLSSSLR